MDEEPGRSKILVIDDELGVRESIRYLFKNEYDVFLADSVDKGLEVLRRERPDAIIMDIRMPEKSGIEGLREIRAIDQQVAVVMLTGFGSLETAQEAIRFGANDYIKKPFEMKEMRRVVEASIAHSRIERTRTSTANELESLNNQLQTELQAKEHLASLGQASSEFVHDLRNPLTVICGYVQLLMDDLANAASQQDPTAKETLEYLEIISKNARRCQEMSQMWRNLAKGDPSRMEPRRVSDIIKEIAANVQPLAVKAGATVEIAVGPPDSVVMADSVQLMRALHNIVNNGLQALGDQGGTVYLSWAASDEMVEIRIEDTGCGITEDQLVRVFEPNFTTKTRTGGMGLGLFITKKVIEAHNGEVTLTNRPDGKGAVACVCLPPASLTERGG